jgi:hypothetical protein
LAVLLITFGKSLLRRDLDVKNRNSTAPCTPDSTANAKERKGNVNVKVSKDITNTNTADRSAYTSDSLRTEQLHSLHLNKALSRTIPPAGPAHHKKGLQASVLTALFSS